VNAAPAPPALVEAPALDAGATHLTIPIDRK
jgi:hypothetical protein